MEDASSAAARGCRPGSTTTSTPPAWPPPARWSCAAPRTVASTARSTADGAGRWRSRGCRRSPASRWPERARPQPRTPRARSSAISARDSPSTSPTISSVCWPASGAAVAVVIDVAAAQEVGHDLLHRDLHQLALAGALALDVRGQDGGGRVDAGAGVADGGAAADGLAIGETGHAHHAADGLRDHVEALVLVVRPRQAEALDARHDDRGLDAP